MLNDSTFIYHCTCNFQSVRKYVDIKIQIFWGFNFRNVHVYYIFRMCLE